MQYRIKYVYKDSRDKGYEIPDYYGPYKIYGIQQEQISTEVYKEVPIPDFPQEEYKGQANPWGRQKRRQIQLQCQEPENCKVSEEQESILQSYEYALTGAGWLEKEYSKFDYDEDEPQQVGRYLIGTEMANFLNFDVDRFINGGCRLKWQYDDELLQDTLVGWDRTSGHNLNDILTRQEVSLSMIHGGGGDHLSEEIPFFIRMYGCKFINTNTWTYDMEEVNLIKSLQQRLEVFCKKVFIPEDNKDKRTNYERYCVNVENLERKELRKRIPKDWCTPPNLEQALAIECYAMIKGNVNLFRCENCGLYTVSNDNRTRVCNRLIYDGNKFNEESGSFEEYYYPCSTAYHNKITRENAMDNLIKAITLSEKKRLYNHFNTYLHKFDYDRQGKLLMEFENIIIKNEGEYVTKIMSISNPDEMIKYGNEYLQLIIHSMNNAINKVLGDKVDDIYLFFRKKNKKVVDIKGKIYGN